MSFGEDEEILQDFLVEAGEILEQLSEQLVDLEQRPDDKELLNAIFRGFHTVKGGAGFLQLNAMVDCCHATENLFDMLRNGKRAVSSELMDVVLQALDLVNAQFDEVKSRQELTPASPELIAALEALINGETPAGSVETAAPEIEQEVGLEPAAEDSASADELAISDDEFEGFLDAITDDESSSTSAPPVAESAASVTSGSDSDEITEDEFESLLDQLHGAGNAPKIEAAKPSASPTPSSNSDEISEDEFDNLLDQLHGLGKAPGVGGGAAPASTDSGNANNDFITDDEFESLLDQLHGQGNGPIKAAKPAASAPKPAAPQAPAKPAASEPAAKPASAAPAQEPQAPAPSPAKPSAPVAAPKPREAAPGANSAAAGETTVRVDTQRLDDIMNMVGELVLVRNRLVRLGIDSADEVMQKAVGNLDVVTADLQTAVMKTRMQPIKKVFGRFPRVVRDLARNLKKEINLELQGEETDLDKNLVEALADPLVHLVRNSVDHGIEVPGTREEKGKPRVGKVILAAEQEGDHILLSITDDGAGMDPNGLRDKAVEKGILEPDAAARLSDTEAFNLIFAPGFSTKTEISDVSGRGVGMDVVKTKITQLNGSIEIKSKIGEGTRFIIKVPLTLAIMPTLMIMVGRQAFALPLVSVNEIFHMDLSRTHVVDGQQCVTIRDHAVPIFELKKWLVRDHSIYKNDPVDGAKEGHVVIVSVGTQRVGFIVDQLIGQEEVVIKPLGKMLQGTPGMAGATITGDGTIALILDVPSLLKRYAGSR